jgi:hypothetical protein
MKGLGKKETLAADPIPAPLRLRPSHWYHGAEGQGFSSLGMLVGIFLWLHFGVSVTLFR